MNSVNFEKLCDSYFKIDLPESISDLTLIALKCLTYCTVLVPIGVAIGLGISKLLNRVRKLDVLSTHDLKVQEIASSTIPGKKNPIQSITESSQEKKACNDTHPFINLPIELYTEILSHLDDLNSQKSLAVVSSAMSEHISKIVKQQIKEYISLALYFDGILRTQTQGNRSLVKDDAVENKMPEDALPFFQFDSKRWKGRIKEIAILGVPRQDECRMDLVEALAEYNIDSDCFDNSSDEDRFSKRKCSLDTYDKTARFLHQMALTEKVSLKAHEIWKQSKNTLKGSMCIIDMSRDTNHHNLWMFNLEMSDWKSHKYYRALDFFPNPWPDRKIARPITLEMLIGKRDGDRLFIPHPQGGEDVILRCSQEGYGRYQSFQHSMVSHLVRYRPKESGEKRDHYNEVVEKLRFAYGDEFVQQQIEDEKQLGRM